MTVYSNKIAKMVMLRCLQRRRRLVQSLQLHETTKIKKRRIRNVPRNFYTSRWMEDLSDPQLLNPESTAAKKFRLRFRVPYPVFIDLMNKAI
jgi:hypothetical protein